MTGGKRRVDDRARTISAGACSVDALYSSHSMISFNSWPALDSLGASRVGPPENQLVKGGRMTVKIAPRLLPL